jgi:hypothetical protein
MRSSGGSSQGPDAPSWTATQVFFRCMCTAHADCCICGVQGRICHSATVSPTAQKAWAHCLHGLAAATGAYCLCLGLLTAPNPLVHMTDIGKRRPSGEPSMRCKPLSWLHVDEERRARFLRGWTPASAACAAQLHWLSAALRVWGGAVALALLMDCDSMHASRPPLLCRATPHYLQCSSTKSV